MSNETERYPTKSRDVASRLLGDEVVAANLSQSSFYNFNPVGTFIWERCDGRHSIKEIGEDLAAEYLVSLQDALKDCLQFVNELSGEGLLFLSDNPIAKSEP